MNRRTVLSRFLLVLTLTSLASVTAAAGDAPPAKIEVTVNGLRSTRGLVRVALFATPAGFPDDHGRAMQRVAVAIAQATSTARFDNVPPGTYAIGVLHDENGNGKMDYRQVVIPDEGYGFSNNARSSFLGPPRFDDAAFSIAGRDKNVTITVNY